MKELIVQGMHGMGDNLHQRALVRQWLLQYDRIFLQSSWISIYHDLIATGKLHIVAKGTNLRTQKKNAVREQSKFYNGRLPLLQRPQSIWYTPDDVRSERGVLAAMCKASHLNIRKADFSLPVKPEWLQLVAPIIRQADGRPIMFYRPLVDRPKDWGGCFARNPDIGAYDAVFQAIRRDFFVISIADLVPDYEWIVSAPIKADLEFHKGELVFEALAALAFSSTLVFASPGFAIVLAQSVGTPVMALFGTYEMGYSFSAGVENAPYLAIEPIEPRDTFTHAKLPKAVDIPRAIEAAISFAKAAIAECPASITFDPQRLQTSSIATLYE